MPTPRQLVRSMVGSLEAQGVTLAPHIPQVVTDSPERLAALMTPDFQSRRTAFQHIEQVAKAGKLVDGTPSAPLAQALFEQIAEPTYSPTFGRCYARTSYAIFTRHHPGEFARIIGQLATKGSVTLASGDVVEWNPQKLPVQNGQYADTLWGAVNHLAAKRTMKRVLNDKADFAAQGQMANVFTRLTGEPHVNVWGDDALPHMNEIVAKHGPMFAEYGNHGGSVANVTYVPESLEAGAAEPQQRTDLGYVVVPLSEAKSRKLDVIQYDPKRGTGYAAPKRS